MLYEEFKEKKFIDKLLNNNYFITKLIDKINDKVEEQSVRLLATELIGTVDWSEIEEINEEINEDD